MGTYALIVTTEELSVEGLASFVGTMGGELIPHETDQFVISNGDTDVWLAIQDHEDFVALHTSETISRWRQALGNRPRAAIELRLDHGHKRKQLYLYVAYAFSLKWNAILDDIDNLVVTAAELARRYREECTDLTITPKLS
jgi:hypothetical protein